MTGPSHREPLDEHERELARVLRALPAGEPPAALDQRILRAAADASATPRRARHRWLAFGGAGWGIGGAAAAVLALGVSWHLIDPTRNGPFERSAPATLEQPSDDAITVTLPEARLVESDAAVTAPGAVPAPKATPRQRSQLRPAPARAQSASPAANSAAEVAPPVAAAPAPPPAPTEPFADLAGTASDATGTWAPEPAGVEAEAQRRAEARAERAEAAREIAAAAIPLQSPARATGESAKVRADSMTPAAWFAEVRRLRDARRHAEAADSLLRFRRAYPHYPVPADLLPLLRE